MTRTSVAIIGSGFAGLGMAIRLQEEGFDDFVILERGSDVGGTWLLPRIVGIERAKRFVYTGEFWDADTALACGLVGEVVPLERLSARGAELAAELAAGPTVAIGEATPETAAAAASVDVTQP